MLSSKLLPEMEMDDNIKKDQLLHGMQSLPVAQQIDKLKVVVMLPMILMFYMTFSKMIWLYLMAD